MAEIKRSDLVDDDGYKVFKDLKSDALDLKQVLDDIKNSGKNFSDALGAGNQSASQLQTTIKGLSDANKLLIAQETQIAQLQTKLTPAYQQNLTIINDLKEAVKLKTALGDKEAISVNAQNSSIVQLNVALNANRVAYSNLSNEQQRNSVLGKQLLKTIQDQQQSLAKLNQSQGIFKDNVGNYTDSIEKAIPAFRKINPAIIEFGESAAVAGKKFLALLLNPVVLAIAAILAGLAAMKKGIDLYIDKTVDGADRAEIFKTKWSTALEVINKGLKSIGKSILDFMGFGQDDKVPAWIEALVTALPGGVAIMATYNSLLKKNLEITALQNELKKEEIALTVELARLDLEKEEEMYNARNKVNRTIEERYDSLKKANNIIEEEIDLKTRSANIELQIIQNQFLKKGITVSSQTDINKLLHDKNVLDKVGYELVEELAKVQTKLIGIEQERYGGARRRQALENELVNEAIQKQGEYGKIFFENVQKEKEETLKSEIEKNNSIINTTQSLYGQKVAAKLSNIQKELELDELAKRNELHAANEKWLSLTELDKEASDRISKEAGDNLQLRAELERKEKGRLISINHAAALEDEKIEQQHQSKRSQIVSKGNADISKMNQEHWQKILETSTQVALEASASIKEVVDNQYSSQEQRAQLNLERLQQNYNEQTALAGNNELAKASLSKNFYEQEKIAQKEINKTKRQQAIFDKEMTLFQIALKTREAIAKDIALSPETFGEPWAGIDLALGLAQAAAVISKPIPQYFKGTEDHPGGLAVVGEQGRELLMMPDHRVMLSPSKATVMDLPEHSQVIPNHETMKIMALAGMRMENGGSSINLNMKEVTSEIKGLRNDMRNQRSSFPNYARTAAGIWELKSEGKNFTRKTLTMWLGSTHR